MKVNPADLVGTSDIARMAGVTNAAVSNWKARQVGFPQPIGTINNGKTELYLRHHVEYFLTYRKDKRS